MGRLALAGGGLGGWQVTRLAVHQDASREGQVSPAKSQGWDNTGRPISSLYRQER